MQWGKKRMSNPNTAGVVGMCSQRTQSLGGGRGLKMTKENFQSKGGSILTKLDPAGFLLKAGWGEQTLLGE